MVFGRSSQWVTSRSFTVYIPARYTVRSSKAERVVPILCEVLFAFLWFVLLQEFLTWGGPGEEFLAILVLTGLLIVFPLWAVGARKVALDVDGEALVYRGWLRPERRFTFSDIGFVQTRQGRETTALWSREGWMLCRLHVTMEGMDTLLADLRSRGALPVEKKPRNRDGPMPLRVPGPRKDEITLELPARVPDWYCLRHPRFYGVIFLLCSGFSAIGAIASLADGAWPVSLCFLVFALGPLAALVLVRRERIECLGDRFLCRPLRGKAYEVRFEQVAAARLRTVATGIGPISGVRLLDGEGKTLIAPSAGMRGTDFLLADLIRRGVPFTY